MDTYQLTYPAPRRCWERTGNGYCSHKWTIPDVDVALAGGAWFSGGDAHEFDRLATKRYALSKGRELPRAAVVLPHSDVKAERKSAQQRAFEVLFEQLSDEHKAQLLKEMEE